MKQKWILWLALFLIVLLIGLIAYDLFSTRENSGENIYEYQLDKFKEIDSNKICYQYHSQIKPSVKGLTGIAVDKDDNIYISAHNKILKYSASGDSITSFKTVDTATCVAISKSGNIFLGMKNYIEQYKQNGKLIKKWDIINKVAYITSLAISDSSIFVADAGNKIVHHYNLNGELIAEIGKRDKEKGIPGLFIPSPYFDVLIDYQGQLWAVNTGRHAFEAYTFSGELITRWERTSMSIDGFSGCCNPTHVAVLSDGSFVTTEKGIARVKIHDKNGDFKCVVAGPDQFIEGTTGLDLATDSHDRILLLDPVKGLLLIFDPD